MPASYSGFTVWQAIEELAGLMGERPSDLVGGPQSGDDGDVWDYIYEFHTLVLQGFANQIATAVGDRSLVTTLPSTEYATPWESIGSLYSSVGSRPVGADGTPITNETLWSHMKDILVDGKVGTAPSPLVSGYTNVWESIETLQVYNATTDDAYLGARPAQFGASTRPAGYDDVWESIETLHARPTGSTTTTTGSGDASVGTKPTEARLLTEVELAPLVSGYDTVQEIDATIGWSSLPDQKLGHAIALSKDGLTLAHSYIDDYDTGVTAHSLSVQIWHKRVSIDPSTGVIPLGGAIGTYYTRGTLDRIIVDSDSFSDAYVSLALNANGSVLVIGHPFEDGGGVVRVYRSPADAVNGSWTNLATETFNLAPTEISASQSGPAYAAFHGYAVATNAQGDIIAVGAPGVDVYSGTDAGLVKVYQIDYANMETAASPHGDWIQMGPYNISWDVDGPTHAESGTSLAMSANGLTLAVGSPNHDAVTSIDLSTHTYFGLAPTSQNTTTTQNHGGTLWLMNFQVMQNSQDIINFADGLSPHAGGSWYHGTAKYPLWHMNGWTGGSWYHGTARPNWTYTVSPGQQWGWQPHAHWAADPAYLTGTSNYSNHWALHQEPIIYTQTSHALDGSVLTAKLSFIYNTPTGHFVSAASPEGPWVIRGSWSDQAQYALGSYSLSQTHEIGDYDIGYVRVYDYIASSWVIRPGGDMLVGQNAGDNLGARRSVAMSDDGLVVALGAPGYDDDDDNLYGDDGIATDTGKVRVWAYSNSTWNPRSVNMTPSSYADLQQNSVVSLSSDGTILAVGGYGNGADAATGAPTVGKVMMLEWQPDAIAGAAYRPIGSALSGDTGSKFGWSVALSGDGMTLGVGAPYHTGGGQVEVFQAVDSDDVLLSGRRIGSDLAPIATSYQASEYTVWSLLDLALVEIQALQTRVSALEP